MLIFISILIAGLLLALVSRTPPHLFFPFGTEPTIFDELLLVREACQIRRLVVGRPCLAKIGFRASTHFVLGLIVNVIVGGRIACFLGSDDVAYGKNPVPGGAAPGP
jgi:hypothetical protein